MRAGIPQFNAIRRIWLISIAAVLLFSLLPQTVAAASPQVNVSPQTTGYTTHVVQAGESLSRIAVRYGVSVQALVTANNIANANQIFVGQRLRIPTTGQQPAPAQQPSACARTHTVVAGETLSGIAVNYSVTIQSLAQANNTTVTSYVYIGQSLCIPSSGTSGGGTSGADQRERTRWRGRPGAGGFWYEVQLGLRSAASPLITAPPSPPLCRPTTSPMPTLSSGARAFGFLRQEEARRRQAVEP